MSKKDRDRAKGALSVITSNRGFEISLRLLADAEQIYDGLPGGKDRETLIAELQDAANRALVQYLEDSGSSSEDLLLANQIAVLVKYNLKLNRGGRMKDYLLETNVHIGPWAGSFTGLGVPAKIPGKEK